MICSRASVPMAENMSACLDTWSAFFLADVLPGIFSYLQNIDNRQVASNEDSFQQSRATGVRLAFGFGQSSGQAGTQNPIPEWPGCDVDRFVPLEIIGVFRVVFVATEAPELAAHDLAAALDNVGNRPPSSTLTWLRTFDPKQQIA